MMALRTADDVLGEVEDTADQFAAAVERLIHISFYRESPGEALRDAAAWADAHPDVLITASVWATVVEARGECVRLELIIQA
ncbi:hypothetical protein ACWDRR_42635 [Kitasatospora sp. NPDC003701]